MYDCPTAPSGQPQGVSARHLSPYSLLVSWQPPLVHLHRGIITSYTIRLETLVGERNVTYFPAHNEEITIESLIPSFEYRISVAASTISIGPYSSPVSVNMPDTCE